MTCKTKHLSSVKDPAPIGFRSTLCYKRIDQIETTNSWDKVTCITCKMNRVYISTKKVSRRKK